jgi:hypothetical protein
MMAKHGNKLTVESAKTYDVFLDKCFDAGLALMHPADRKDLGKHCFAYVELTCAHHPLSQPP